MTHKLLTLFATAAMTLSFGVVEYADAGTGQPGRKGTATAYAPTKFRVLDSKRCTRGKYAVRYAGCVKLLRSQVKRELCGRGVKKARWYLQRGDGAKIRQTVSCSSSVTSARKGRVTAYFPTRSTYFDSVGCSRFSSGAYRYAACSKRLRSRVKSRICSRRGKGLHKYHVQIGNRPRTRTSVYCKR